MVAIAELHPRPLDLTCSFTSRVHLDGLQRASVAVATKLRDALAEGEALSPSAKGRLAEQADGWRSWLRPGFEAGYAGDWFEQHGRILILWPDSLWYEVNATNPSELGQIGKTIVRGDSVVQEWERLSPQRFSRQGPLSHYAEPDHLRAQVDQESLLVGWAVKNRILAGDNTLLEMERNILIGTVPNECEEDWPVPFFGEADRLIVVVDRAKHAIASIQAESGGLGYLEFVYSDIVVNRCLTAAAFERDGHDRA